MFTTKHSSRSRLGEIWKSGFLFCSLHWCPTCPISPLAQNWISFSLDMLLMTLHTTCSGSFTNYWLFVSIWLLQSPKPFYKSWTVPIWFLYLSKFAQGVPLRFQESWDIPNRVSRAISFLFSRGRSFVLTYFPFPWPRAHISLLWPMIMYATSQKHSLVRQLVTRQLFRTGDSNWSK